MNKLEQLEKTIAELEPDEFSAFSTWFEALQAERWDRQLATDIGHGTLDRLAAEALADFRQGKVKPL